MKLTYEQKLLIVEDYKEIGLFATAKKWQVSNDTVGLLVRLHKNNCLLPHGKNNKYSPDFKVKVVKAYANGEGSFQKLAIKFGIPSKQQIIKWYRIYQSQGEEQLRKKKADTSKSDT